MADPLSQMLATADDDDGYGVAALSAHPVERAVDRDAAAVVAESETRDVPGNDSASPEEERGGSLSRADSATDREVRDLTVVVDNPEKHIKAMESYVTFRVTTKTTRSDFENPEYCVRRRYNDFLWLHARLEEKYQAIIVPPLPEKHRMTIDRFEQDFVHLRQVALDTFMGRVTQHPILSTDSQLQVFLTFKDSEFSSHVKKSGSSLLSKMAGTLHSATATTTLKKQEPWDADLQDFAVAFGEKMSNMERVAQRLLQEESDYAVALREWAGSFETWSKDEDKLQQALKAMGQATASAAKAQEATREESPVHVLLPMKEYIQFAEIIKGVLKHRHTQQAEVEALSEELFKKRQLLEGGESSTIASFLGRNQEEARQSRVAKLEQQIADLARQVDQANDKLAVADADLKADVQRWQAVRAQDLKALFMGMADRHVAMYSECIRAWEEAVPVIRDSDLSAEVLAS